MKELEGLGGELGKPRCLETKMELGSEAGCKG